VSVPIHMPQIGFGQESATLLTWHRSIGEHIARGEVIAEVEVEKTNMDVEVHASGTVTELLCERGEEISVGQIIARLDPDPTELGRVSSPR
jgi:pyruvate dehydrogenase E2 component (dihydrolipoamide acetyltransferase)